MPFFDEPQQASRGGSFFDDDIAAPPVAAGGGRFFDDDPAPAPTEGGVNMGASLVGAAALAAAAYLTHKTGLMGKALSTANTVRQQLMLSGFAPLKSILGNIGAVSVAAAESKSMRPITELFSGQGYADARAAWKAGTPSTSTYPALSIAGKELWTPGRFMGALDETTQKALQRSGMTPVQSAKATMQAPIGGRLGDALNSDAARYLIPFRRTPFNQFFEGLDTMKGSYIKQHPYVHAGVAAAGATHGAATSDEQYPVSIGFGTALAAKYGMPYALAALVGRTAMGAKTGGSIAGTVLPVSEYGIESGLRDPLAPFEEPAALRALRQLRGEH